MERVFQRHSYEPLITTADLPFAANGVLNPGVAYVNSEVVLLLRIETREGISHIRVARSYNGVDNWRIADHPLLEPDLPEWPFEEWGCEDARVTQTAPDTWVIAYTAYSRYGPAVALASTHDFESVERLGIVHAPTNKDATLFPQKFDDNWLMLHRPVTGEQEHVWYASSPDLQNWTAPGVLLPVRGGPWWDGVRIGVGAPPILTQQGWLLIYHGVKDMGGHPVYRLGLTLLDKDNPRKVLCRASEWVFSPEAPFETRGLVPNVVFTCGTLCQGDEIWMYYGGADTAVGLARAKVDDLLQFVWEHNYMPKVGREKGMIE